MRQNVARSQSRTRNNINNNNGRRNGNQRGPNRPRNQPAQRGGKQARGRSQKIVGRFTVAFSQSFQSFKLFQLSESSQ